MESAKKSLEIQAKVRHNAEEFKNTMSDLYSWEKQMKEKERDMLQKTAVELDAEHLKTLPVRSHVVEQPTSSKARQQQQQQIAKQPPGKDVTADTPPTTLAKGVEAESNLPSPTEKPDPNEEKRQQANQIKDRGNKHVQLGEYEKAINEYTAAIAVYPEDYVYYSNRAFCHLKLERYEKCIEDCERAIEIDNLAVKAYYRRMQANECLGNNMDALKDCTTVLMIEPKNSEALRSLDRINELLRKHTKSLHGPNFSPLRNELVDILPVDKPAYKRSTKTLRRVPIADVVGPKDTKNFENTNLKISDEDIDKLFNSNCGPFVEVKQPTVQATKTLAQPPIASAQKISTATNQQEPQNKAVLSTKDSNSKLKSQTDAISAQPQIDRDKRAPTTVDSKSIETANASEFSVNTNRPAPPAPTSTAQFYSNWKELLPAQKYQYLKSIEISNLCKILGAGFDSDTLTDVLHTLRDHYLTNGEITTADTLLEISKNNQVAILSLLMSANERKVLTDILNSIKESNSDATVASLIAKNFNLD